jgi:hypothetical protein
VLADAPFFGPGDHPTHALHAVEAVGYRTLPAPVGYFAQRKAS